ncbi:MAG: radical SAM protein [Acidobacteriota bacterium]
MHILLYVPDNQVTNNFVPQLWPFVLQRLTPDGHRVSIIDGNAQHYSEEELVEFIRRNKVELVGMGFMTRMAQKAYRMAQAIRQRTRVRVVMGGPHVTEVPSEPLGLTGHPRCADSVVLGEADDTWPVVVRDAARGQLREVYHPVGPNGKDLKPTLQDYPIVAWDQIDLSHFNLMRFVPSKIRWLLKQMGVKYDGVYVVPVESGRGCPYGCEFCTVTGFFGDQIRFRDNDNVIEELLRLKAMAQAQNALVNVFFIDDNFAINRKRTKSLLRDMIERDACVPWIGQISMNLLKDEELVRLIAASGGRWVFMGLESIDPDSLKVAHKEFNKPEDYAAIQETLARHGLYAITSFIFGMEGDRVGVSRKTCDQIDTWAPGLPVFGILTPYPATPLYDRLREEGRLTRPEHWLDFKAFKAAYIPKNLSGDEAEAEVRRGWTHCYSPAAIRKAQRWLRDHDKTFGHQVMHFVARLLFRGIYFPQMTRWAWIKLLARNSSTVAGLVYQGLLGQGRRRRRRPQSLPVTENLTELPVPQGGSQLEPVSVPVEGL